MPSSCESHLSTTPHLSPRNLYLTIASIRLLQAFYPTRQPIPLLYCFASKQRVAKPWRAYNHPPIQQPYYPTRRSPTSDLCVGRFRPPHRRAPSWPCEAFPKRRQHAAPPYSPLRHNVPKASPWWGASSFPFVAKHDATLHPKSGCRAAKTNWKALENLLVPWR